ncbi:MAG: zf-HC2 domain-containing protein [Planctomycetes bacterium]|nr:zf-HC2 domain-containing protein [Planctomycetota bacterium]
MCCAEQKHQLGRFLDDELDPAERAAFSDHLDRCAACSFELAELRKLSSAIVDPGNVDVPAELWTSIEDRLEAMKGGPSGGGEARPGMLRVRRWMIAASIGLAAGLGVIGLSLVDSSAEASVIDYKDLLDGLPLDARKAFRTFLDRYNARPGSPTAAKRFAPSLSFDTPPTLPGGFRLVGVHLLDFGNRPGVAASYDRDGEFLAVIFHTPVKKEEFGTHRDYPCAIGKHRGQKVEVGTWTMVHLTDPTTCHCVLSQLDGTTELPAVMAAVAPSVSAALLGDDRE